MTNDKKTIYYNWFLMAIAWVIAVFLICGHVSAEETKFTNGSSINVSDSQPLPLVTNDNSQYPMTTSGIHYLQQGDTVYLNDTVDGSGVMQGYEELAYWDGYNLYDESPSFNISTPIYKSEYYHYWIDPSIFSNHLGKWYRYNGKFNANANDIAFIVKEKREEVAITLPNGTVHNATIPDTDSIYTRPLLPNKAIADYLVARGDNLTIQTGGMAKVYIGGRVDGLLDYTTMQHNITFDGEHTQTLEPGTYTLIIEYPGENNQFDVRYTDDKIQYRDGWNGIRTIDVLAYTPDLMLGKLKEAISATDDTYVEKRVVVQDASTTIEGFSEVPIFPEYKDFKYYSGLGSLVTMFDVRGYSNLNPNATISIVLDKDRRTPKDLARHTFTGETTRQFDGNMSYYQIYVPIVWDDMVAGEEHTLTVSDPLGGGTEKTFPISQMPADSFRPNATVKYALNSSPWVPTPTPEIIKEKVVVTVVQTQVVVEKRAPTQEEIKAAQEQIIKDIVIKYGTYLGVIAIIVIAGYFIVRFIYRARKRKMWEKR